MSKEWLDFSRVWRANLGLGQIIKRYWLFLLLGLSYVLLGAIFCKWDNKDYDSSMLTAYLIFSTSGFQILLCIIGICICLFRCITKKQIFINLSIMLLWFLQILISASLMWFSDNFRFWNGNFK